MSGNEAYPHVTGQPTADPEILWGAAAIGAAIGRTKRQVLYLASRGVLPIQKKGRNTLVARRSQLLAALTFDEGQGR